MENTRPGDDDQNDPDRTILRSSVSTRNSGTVAAQPLEPRNTSGNALASGTRIREYEILGTIGEGGFAIVYKALDNFPRVVAIKEYIPSSLAARFGATRVAPTSERNRDLFEHGMRSFMTEAQLLAELTLVDHPSLVKVFGLWEENGTAYMVMPFYEGITLKERLAQLPAPPAEDWLLNLLEPLTQALTIIHSKSFYHRDISPDNIQLLHLDETPVLLDFGAARRVVDGATNVLSAILKDKYAPIEQYGEMPGTATGPWTDIYALAAVIHYAIVGGAPPISVGRLSNDTYVPLAKKAFGRYSQPFLSAIDRCLEVRPENRPQSVADLRKALGFSDYTVVRSARSRLDSGFHSSSYFGELDGPRSTLSATAPQQSKPRGRGVLIGTGLVVAAALIGVALSFAWQRTDRTTSKAADPEIATKAADTPAPTIPPPAAAPVSLVIPAASQAQSVPQDAQTPAQSAPSIESEFGKILSSQDASFAVTAQPANDPLKIGASLDFVVRSAKSGFVYVLYESTDRSLSLLFPNSQSSANSIVANTDLHLPQPNWRVHEGGPVGSERYLVIVSKARRTFSALSKKRMSWFLVLPGAEELAAKGLLSAAGASPLAGTAQCTEPQCGAYGATAFTIQVVR